MSIAEFFEGQAFDTSTVEPQEDFKVLPPGDYPVVIEGAEIKATKAGTGHYLEIAFQILDGPAKGRKLWDRLNIDNPNQTAVEIGRRCLSALGRAIGVSVIQDEKQLLNGICFAVVKVKGDNNEIRTYKPVVQGGGEAQPQSVAPPAPPAAPAQQATVVPPQTLVQPRPVQHATPPATPIQYQQMAPTQPAAQTQPPPTPAGTVPWERPPQ